MSSCPVCRFELSGSPDTCPDCNTSLTPSRLPPDENTELSSGNPTAPPLQTLYPGLELPPSFQVTELLSPNLALGLCSQSQQIVRIELLHAKLAPATLIELRNWFKASQDLPEDRRPPLSNILEVLQTGLHQLLIIESFPGPPLLKPPSPLSHEQLLEVPRLAEWLQRYQSLSGIRPDDWRWTPAKPVLCGALGARIRSLGLTATKLEAAKHLDALAIRNLLLELLLCSAETPPWAQELLNSQPNHTPSQEKLPQSAEPEDELADFVPDETQASDLDLSTTAQARANLSIAQLLRIMTRDLTPQTLTPTRRTKQAQSSLEPQIISVPVPELSIASGAPFISKARQRLPGPHFIPSALVKERERLQREAAQRLLEPPVALRDYQILQLSNDLRIYPTAAWIILAACAPNLPAGLLSIVAAFALWPLAPFLSREPNPALLFIIPVILAIPPFLAGYSSLLVPALVLAILHASRATIACDYGREDKAEKETPLDRSLQATRRIEMEQSLARTRLAVSAGLGLAISIIPAVLASLMTPATALVFAFSLGMTFTIYSRSSAEQAHENGESFSGPIRKSLIYASILSVLPLSQTPLALLCALASAIAFSVIFSKLAEPAFDSELKPQNFELDTSNLFAELDPPPPPDLNSETQLRTASKLQRLQ